MLALPGLAAPLETEDFDRGKALYENHCTACHDAAVHTRHSSLVKNRGDLQLFVSTWSFHAQLGWSREEIIDVTDYLDRSYYRFTGQP
jgi:cytochrome c